MELDELFTNYPRLYHMAEAGTWSAIKEIGLKTTTQLVDECGVDIGVRRAILAARRTSSHKLLHPQVGEVTIRDQLPLKEHNLRKALIDLSIEEWLQVLNSQVFFWLDERRLNRLLGARSYRAAAHDVLVLDTQELVGAYHSQVRLAHMNTGSTIFPNASMRGSETFLPIEQFPFQDRRRVRPLQDTVVELAVLGGVPDVWQYVIEVQRRTGATVEETFFKR